LKLQSKASFGQLLERAQHTIVSQMHLGDGIALNEALRENLFMLLVSVMNQIPILVIGKPGCSKSLAVSILQDNLKGSVSDRQLFKTMPAIEVLPYQCPPLSTADGIQNAFDNARKYQGGGDGSKTVVVVLLDEVGLAEESPHLPLKVLHKELEKPGEGITCIGISNWALDAAKMSR
jgi:MoxR-like ATPase